MKIKNIALIAACLLVCSAFHPSKAGDVDSGMHNTYVNGERTLEVVNFTAKPLVVDGLIKVTGAGGLRLPSLSLKANACMVLDPVRTPVFVASAPSFAPGAKIALANRFCSVKRARFVLATWRGDAAVPADIFDAKSVAGKSVITVEKAPDGVSKQLVVTVGDFASSPEVRILALGDSITEGVQKPEQAEHGFPQYRTSLAALLATRGVKAVMVGSRDMSQLDAAGVQAPKEWTRHFGCSGITTHGQLDNKANWVKDGESPDYVTLLIGTNDIHGKCNANNRDAAANEVFNSWKKLVDEIAARWPKAKILGATILDRNFYNEGPVGHDLTVRINKIIKSELKAGRLPKNFQIVDLYKICPLAEEGVFFDDKLHPNWKGQMAIAEAFFEAVKANAATFSAVSPDGNNEIRLETGYGAMRYSVLRGGKTIVEPIEISLSLAEFGRLDGRGANPVATKSTLGGRIATPIYKKASVDLTANVTRVDFGDWAFSMCARNDGVAWRFETKLDGEVIVSAEETNIRFPKGTELCYGQVGGFATGFETLAKFGPVESVKPGVPQIVITPFTASVPGAGVVCITESDLLDYPGLNFHRRGDETDTLRSWQAGTPSETERRERWICVKNRHSYLAKTRGERTYPWRVFVLGDTPSDLVAADTVYALASSGTPGDFSWVKTGLVQWDWWHGFQITDIPGLKTGCNYETYKAYIDFAAANGIPYIIMDEGWSEYLNLDKPRAEANVEGVIKYGQEKGVGVILWAAWSMLAEASDRARVFDRYAAMGAKGFKIDFMDRDDQMLERFLQKTAADAAARKLVVMYHGIHKPTGLQRAYPNILNYEGVFGLEQGRGRGGQDMPPNDCTLPYTRMVAGFMDYTPGGMRNRVFGAPDVDGQPFTACYGTRCHQLALFPIFEAPVQMLCDSPTQYRTAPECTAFIAKVPTTWDDTVGVAGEIGKFSAVARKKGGEWWLGVITDWTARELDLSTAFLGSGEWEVEAFEDAVNSDKNAEHYIRRKFTIKAGDALRVSLASGGGFAARFTPVVDKR